MSSAEAGGDGRSVPAVAPAGPAFALEAEHLSKSFGGVRVLDDVSIRVRQGEIHGLVGANGSGSPR